MDNIIGVLLMVKNEHQSIKTTIESTSKFFKHIIIFDTGSTDNTLDIIKNTCNKNNQKYHIKSGIFKSFPESRNDALEFAETINVKFLLLMDAGDVFQTKKTKSELFQIIDSIPTKFKYGTIKQEWIERDGEGISDHVDIRFVRNKANCRYNLEYPVHEVFKDVETSQFVDLTNMISLFQDRPKYAQSTGERYHKDIELLLKAPENKRNLYFLAQSYMSIDDYKNGFKYNVKCLESDTNASEIDNKFVLVRCGFCAMKVGLSEKIIMKYFLRSIQMEEPPIDSFIYILKYYIETKQAEKALPYLIRLASLEKSKKIDLINHTFYDYTRWHLISIVTLMTKTQLELGKYACLKAINVANRPDDLNNIKLFADKNDEDV